MTPLEIAKGFLARGWNPVPVAYRGKKPIGLEWQKQRLFNENVAEHFGPEPMNVGVQLGEASRRLTDANRGLTDADLDSPEAAAVAPRLMPATDCIFGRASNRASHRLYYTALCKRLDKATIQFKDPTPKGELPPGAKSMLLELRIGGGEQGAQTVGPGSGESVEFEPGCDGEPAIVDGDYLLTYLKQTAAAALAARYWPPEGSRHGARLAVTGLLARAGIEQARAMNIIETIAVAAGDREIGDARSDVTSTYKQLAEGRPITGIKQAREVFGDRVADCLANWLGCPPDSSESGRPLSEAEAEAKIVELGKLSPLGYAKARAKAAKEIGLQPAELDKLIKEARRASGTQRETAGAGRPVEFENVEPWGEEVSGADLLDRLAAQLRQYVVMTPHQALAVALWVIHAHMHDASDSSPKLIIKSQQKRSGKTRLVEVLARLVPRPLFTSGITASAFLRLIESYQPTVLLDEIDAAMKANKEMAEAFRGLMNSGFSRTGARHIMNVPVADGGYEPRAFSTWAPQLLSGIGNLADTVRDRGIEIEMKRKLRSEKVRRLRNRDGSELADLRRMAVRWAADNTARLLLSDPEIPDGLNDRASDAWEPLLAIAELAGGDWPRRAGEAARLLSGDGAVEDENQDAMLFADIQRAFDEKGVDRLSSTELTTFLLTLDDRPWPEWQNGRSLSKSQLSRTLKRYGIVSGTIRLEGVMTLKGYYLGAFTDAFQRYTVRNQAAESVTPSHP